MTLYKNKYRRESTRLKNWDYSWPGCYFLTICTKNMEMSFGKIIHKIIVLSECGKIAEKIWREIPTHFPAADLDAFIVMPNHVHGIIIINDIPNAIGSDAINRVATDGIPITTDGIPITTDGIPITTDGIPITTDGIPATTDGIPATTDGIPTATDGIPTATDGIPATTDGIPTATDGIPTATDGISLHNPIVFIPDNICTKSGLVRATPNMIDINTNDKHTAMSLSKIGGITGEKNPMLYENISRMVRWFKGRTSFEARKIEPSFAWQAGFYDRIIRSKRELYYVRRYIADNPLNYGHL